MARTRNIKPSFFQNDALGELSPLARLLFIGMWTIADYKGCLELRPKRIKAQLLPYDDCDIDALVSDLDKSRFVTIYSVKGQRYIKISNFEKHQNPHPNEKKTGSDIPDISEKDKEISDLPSLEKNHEQNVTDPALSLIPYPSSLTPQQGAAAPLVGVAIEVRPEVLDAIEQQLAENLTEPTPVPKRQAEPDAQFERAWSLYPKRDGGNPRKEALAAWSARRREGVPAEDMIAGVERYAAHMKARGKIGTPYVMQAATFFGPAARYAEDWPAAVPQEPRPSGRPSINAPFQPGADDNIFDELRRTLP